MSLEWEIFSRIDYYDDEIVGKFVADIIVDINLLLNFGEHKVEVKKVRILPVGRNCGLLQLPKVKIAFFFLEQVALTQQSIISKRRKGACKF